MLSCSCIYLHLQNRGWYTGFTMLVNQSVRPSVFCFRVPTQKPFKQVLLFAHGGVLLVLPTEVKGHCLMRNLCPNSKSESNFLTRSCGGGGGDLEWRAIFINSLTVLRATLFPSHWLLSHIYRRNNDLFVCFGFYAVSTVVQLFNDDSSQIPCFLDYF